MQKRKSTVKQVERFWTEWIGMLEHISRNSYRKNRRNITAQHVSYKHFSHYQSLILSCPISFEHALEHTKELHLHPIEHFWPVCKCRGKSSGDCDRNGLDISFFRVPPIPFLSARWLSLLMHEAEGTMTSSCCVVKDFC